MLNNKKKKKRRKTQTHPSLNFLRLATALFLIMVLTSRPPELSPSLVDVPANFPSSSLAVATLDNRLLMLLSTLFMLLVTADDELVPTELLLYMFSFETLRNSLPKSLPSSKSDDDELLRSGDIASGLS